MKKKFNRRSIRLPGYDYSQSGAYFITLCSQNRKPVFGNILNGKSVLSEIGLTASKFIEEIPHHFDDTNIDEYIIMPNHIHLILIIVGVQNFEPQRNEYQNIIPKSVGSIIRSYKASVTRWCGENGFKYFRWQRNYFEHIIRNDSDFIRIKEYIQSNPLQWELDDDNPNRKKKSSFLMSAK